MRKARLLLTGVALSALAQGSFAEDQKGIQSVLFVLDRSGSMYEMLPSIKTSITQITSAMPRDHYSGLLAFDGCDPATDIEYMVPMGRGNASRIASTVAGIQAEGGTHLALALSKAGEIIKTVRMCPRVIVFTDNMDTCGGNPSDIAEKFNREKQTYCMELDVITATQDEAVQRQLEDLAESLNGQLHLGQTAEEILAALQRIFERERSRGGAIFDPKKPDGGKDGTGTGQDGEEDDGGEREREREKERDRDSKNK